jgi:hypothetical protein
MVSIVDPELSPLMGNGVARRSTTPPAGAQYASRNEMRLLSDTRRVLEYLSKGGRGVSHMYKTWMGR